MTEFSKAKNSSGYHTYCRPCDRQKRIENATANPYGEIFRSKRFHAKKTGIPFTLVFDEMVWPTYCPALGMELDYRRYQSNKGGMKLNSPSFDRIDPTKGYTTGNVVIVSQLANQVKSCATVEQLRKITAYYEQLIP